MQRKGIILLLAVWSAGSLSFASDTDNPDNDCQSDARVVARRCWLTGRVESESGSNTDAVELFRKAVKLVPDEKEYRKSLIWSLIETNKTEEAKATAKQAAKKWQQDIDLLELADAPLTSYKELAEGLRANLLKDKDNCQLHLDLARCLIHLRGLDEGFEEIVAAISKAPGSLECKIYLLRYVGEFLSYDRGAYELQDLARQEAESVLELIGQDRALLRTYIIEATPAAPDVCARAAKRYLKKYHYAPSPTFRVDATFDRRLDSLRKYAAQNDQSKTALYVARLIEDCPKNSFIVMSADQYLRRYGYVGPGDQMAIQYQASVCVGLTANDDTIKRITNDLDRKITQAWRGEISKVWGTHDIAIGSFVNAEKWLKYSIDHVSTDPYAWMRLSQAAVSLQHRDVAIAACDKAIKLGERDPHIAKDAPFWQFAASLQVANKLSFGKTARKAMQLGAKDSALLQLLLLDDLEKRAYHQIANDLDAYIRYKGSPSNVKAVVEVAIAKALASNADSTALAIYTKAVPFIDLNGQIHYIVAGALLRGRNVADAIKAISKAIDKSPKEAVYRRSRTSLWLMAGNRKNAEQDWRTAVALGDKTFSMEKAMATAQRLKGSLSNLDLELLGRNTDPIRSDGKKQDQLREAEICITQGRYREAYEIAKTKLVEGCDKVRALRVMAIASEATGDKKHAAELRDQVVQATQASLSIKAH